MAISSASLQHQYKETVNPWDLNIFASILQQKQQKFDAGAAAIQSKVDNFASLDVIADTDKEYLNSKVNETVKGISSLGGADLSDSSVISQLSGYVGNIGKDERIINAVTDTKKIRSMQTGRAQINKDFNAGKKGVYRSDANEWMENQSISKYLQSKNEDSSSRYDGPMAPISYSDYHKRYADAAKQIKASSVPVWSPTQNKYMYRIGDREAITEEQVMEMAATSLSPDDRAQMARDGQFHYRNASDEQILDEFNVLTRRNLSKLDRQIDNLNVVKGIEAATEKEKLIKQRDNLQSEIDNRKLSLQKILTSDRSSAINSVFTNRYVEGLVNRYSYVKETAKPVWDQGRMFVDKMKQDDKQFNARLSLDSQKLQHDINNDAQDAIFKREKLRIEALEAGMDLTDDGRLIHGTGVKGKKGDSEYPFVVNSEPGNTQLNVEEILKTDNDRLKVAKEQVAQSFFNEYALKHDEDGRQGMFKKVGSNYIPTDKWKKANIELYQASQDLINGRQPRISSLPEEFVNFKRQRRALDIQQSANQDRIDDIRTTALDRTRATVIADNRMNGTDWEAYQRGKEIAETKGKKVKEGWDFKVTRAGVIAPREQPTHTEVDTSKLSEADKRAYSLYSKNKSRVEGIYANQKKNVESEMSSQLNDIGTSFSKQQMDSAGLTNAIIAQTNGYYTLNGKNGIDKKPEENKESINARDFTPIGKVRTKLDGVNTQDFIMGETTTGTGDDKVTQRVMIPIDKELASKVDAFAISPSAHINKAIAASPNRTITDVSYGIPKGGRVNLAVEFKVTEVSKGRNIIKVKQPFDSDGNPLSEPLWININREYSTPAEAHEMGQSIAPLYQQNEETLRKAGKTLPFREYILKLSN